MWFYYKTKYAWFSICILILIYCFLTSSVSMRRNPVPVKVCAGFFRGQAFRIRCLSWLQNRNIRAVSAVGISEWLAAAKIVYWYFLSEIRAAATSSCHSRRLGMCGIFIENRQLRLHCNRAGYIWRSYGEGKTQHFLDQGNFWAFVRISRKMSIKSMYFFMIIWYYLNEFITIAL